MRKNKTDNFNIKTIYYLVKDNLSLLIILPPIFGGLWQIIELSSLSLSFLRFFSVSQLVADGLLILIVFLIFFFSLLILPIYNFWVHPPSDKLNEIMLQTNQSSKNKYVDNSYVDRNPLISFIFYFGFIFLLTYGIVNYIVISIKELIIFTLVGFFLIYLLVNFYIKERNKTKKYKKVVFLSSIYLFITILVYISIFCRHIHNLFLLPKDLVNVEILKTNTSNKYPNDTIEILYSNDKYIFFEIKNKKSKILIVPFDELFIEKSK